MEKWLSVTNVSKTFYKKKMWQAKQTTAGGIKHVSFEASEDIVGVLGESGSGKTTLMKLIAGIEKPDSDSGEIRLTLAQQSVPNKGQISMIFQEYTTAINPEFTVEEALMESLSTVDEAVAKKQIRWILAKVNVGEEYINKKALQLSGGQIQRVCIARSILSNAKVLIFDEAFHSLDLINIDRILTLLIQLQKEFQLKYLFVTHNLELATYFCEKIIFLKEGSLEEDIATEKLLTTTSSYVQALIAAQL